MSNYINDNLQKDEEVIATAKFSYLRTIPYLFFWVVFFICCWFFYTVIKSFDPSINMLWYPILFGIIGGLPFLLSILDVKMTELAVTNRRVIGKRGIISLKTTDVLINKVDTVTMQATLLGRLLNYYTIEIQGCGKSVDKVITTKYGTRVIKENQFKGVKNAEEIKNIINVAIEYYADEARKAQATDIANAFKH